MTAVLILDVIGGIQGIMSLEAVLDIKQSKNF